MAEEVITVYNGEEINIKSGADLIPLVTSISDELLDSAEKFDNPKVAYNSPGSLIVDDEGGGGGDVSANDSKPADDIPSDSAKDTQSALNSAPTPVRTQTVVWLGMIKAIDRLSKEGAYLAFSLISAKDHERCKRMNKSLFARLDDLTPNEKSIYKFTVNWLEEYEALEKQIQNNGLSEAEIQECATMAAQIAKEQGIEINPWLGLVAMLVVPIGMNIVTAVRLGGKGFNPSQHLAKPEQDSVAKKASKSK